MPLAIVVFCLKSGKLIALDAINLPLDFIKAKQLILAGLSITQERIEDTDTDWFS